MVSTYLHCSFSASPAQFSVPTTFTNRIGIARSCLLSCVPPVGSSSFLVKTSMFPIPFCNSLIVASPFDTFIILAYLWKVFVGHREAQTAFRRRKRKGRRKKAREGLFGFAFLWPPSSAISSRRRDYSLAHDDYAAGSPGCPLPRLAGVVPSGRCRT